MKYIILLLIISLAACDRRVPTKRFGHSPNPNNTIFVRRGDTITKEEIDTCIAEMMRGHGYAVPDSRPAYIWQFDTFNTVLMRFDSLERFLTHVLDSVKKARIKRRKSGRGTRSIRTTVPVVLPCVTGGYNRSTTSYLTWEISQAPTLHWIGRTMRRDTIRRIADG